MAALDTTARQEGHKAMEEAISAAARVRRQLKAGRPRKTRSLQLNTFEAMGRIVNEADRARGLMRGAGLDPDDVRLGLIMRTGTNLLCKRLPPPGETGPFFKAISEMASVQFLGILWEQADRDAEVKGRPGFVCWITPFVAEPEYQELLLALQASIRASGSRMPN
ncbi:MAG: hypothetical protein WBX09_15010 [Terracidiphilus sp.]